MLRQFRGWLMSLIVVGLIAAAAVVSLWPRPQKVQVAMVTSGWMEVAIQQDGVTRIKDRYLVSATVGGKLSRIGLRPGDPIQRGQSIIAVIHPTPPAMLDARQIAQLSANVEAAKRQVELSAARRAQAEAQLRQAESTYGRVKSLRDQEGVSLAELELAEVDYRTKSENLRVANFEFEIRGFEQQQAEVALRHYTDEETNDPLQFEIRAPIDGVVLRVHEESSTVVAPGTPLLEVGNAADLEIVVDVLSTDAVKIQVVNAVILNHWGGEQNLLAEVRRVEPAAFTKVSALGVEEQRVNVIADFREPAAAMARLGDQYRVEARIVVWKENQIIQVPNNALFRLDGQWAVFVVQDQKLKATLVEVGKRNDTHAQILAGVQVDQQVVIYPSDLLEDGQAVEVHP
ncbi:MAG: HlyD family efflux transporter periplasmic adaptor subunit [Planctomycetaceae bacterium]|nr:HlyD family efflux transporter periplasmic adaptor subunit [Planctomycetaceae bacterium]